MPHANIWIRRDNFEAWKDIEEKSDFVNFAIEKDRKLSESPPYTDKPKIEGMKTASEITCCDNRKTPCKHWVWDVNKVVWVNSRTGEIREEA